MGRVVSGLTSVSSTSAVPVVVGGGVNKPFFRG